jgi:high-affinity iron transporter
MTAAFFIMLREGLEAALIVGIIGAYLTKIGRRDAVGSLWLGVAAAVAVSVAAGIAVFVTVGELPEVYQATFEAAAAILALAVVTWMLFWMRRQGRALKGELERGAAVALGRGSTTALAGLAFVAVVREGLETAVFLLAIVTSNGQPAATLVGALAGLAVAVIIGWAIFRAGVRINLRRFFTATGVVLIFVAAGLTMSAVTELSSAGFVPAAAPLFDFSRLLPESGAVGSLLAGLFGYRETPTALQLAFYLVYLVPVLLLFLFEDRLPRRQPVRA